MPETHPVGERIALHRRRAGLSQIEFANLVGRSESWVSQVERGVRAVDCMLVLQRVADVLSVSVAELRDDQVSTPEERPEAFDTIRLALTGHPALGPLLDTAKIAAPRRQLGKLRSLHAEIWQLVHASRYTELAPVLAELVPDLETATRTTSGSTQAEAYDLLCDSYQAAAAMMAKLGEADAAWIAADRAGFCAERAGSPLGVAAAMFRMAHVFLALRQSDKAHRVALNAAQSLEARVKSGTEPEVLSLYGALHLVLAVAAARDNERAAAHGYLDAARRVAKQLGADRNDFGTEFGPTNVAIHAVSIAVELGDAGHAIDLSRHVDTSGLSPERQARYLLDVAQAHAMRRHTGEALHALLDAEQVAPEETRVHHIGRAVTRELLQLSGPRPRPELRDLAERFGVLP